MNNLQVVNIKCGGCVKSITAALEKEGLKNVSVEIENQTVNFEGDPMIAKGTLSKIGYPEIGSEEAKSLIKKGQSFVSCAIGKMQ